MHRFVEYSYLVDRVDRWSMQDLEDLLVEIERDTLLDDTQRQELLRRMYAVLWRRAQRELQQPNGKLSTIPGLN